MKMKKEIKVISIALLIMVLVLGFLGFSFQYLAEEQSRLGGSYEECMEDHLPRVCKDTFLF